MSFVSKIAAKYGEDGRLAAGLAAILAGALIFAYCWPMAIDYARGPRAVTGVVLVEAAPLPEENEPTAAGKGDRLMVSHVGLLLGMTTLPPPAESGEIGWPILPANKKFQ